MEMAKTRHAIEATVGANPVVIFTYEWSPFSLEAKTLLDGLGVSYQEISLGREWLPGLIKEDGARIRAALLEMTGQSSLPHIFVNGKSIGGLFSGTPGLVPALEQGTFMKMVHYGALSWLDDEMSLR
jgi:glutaredoxin